MAACQQCRLKIPANASICTHCSSYQDWRRYFNVSTTVLALLTALISVLGVTLPSIIAVFHTPKSEILQPIITIEGTTIRFMVTNSGDAPGMFIRAFTQGEYLAGATKVRLRDDHKAIIGSGSNLLTFDIVPLLTQEQSYLNSLEMIQLIIQNKEPPQTDVVFHFGDSDGTIRTTKLTLDAQSIFEMMRANSDRCSAIKEPDFDNGCIGPGELPS